MNAFPETLKRLFSSHHSMPREQLLKFLPPQSICAEVGVWKGEYSSLILRTCRPAELHLIDTWEFQPAGAQASSALYGLARGSQAEMDRIYLGVKRRLLPDARVHIHRTDSLTAVREFPDAYFDFVYIDADHTFEACLSDLRAYYPKVKRGGILAGDDYGEDGRWWGDGVTRAVNEFSAEIGVKPEIDAHQFIFRC